MRHKYMPQDNAARLNGGICFYKGHPYILYAENNINTGVIYRLGEKRALLSIDLKSQELDLAAPKLGYINHGGEAIYITRAPSRRYKQTLELSALTGRVCGEHGLGAESLSSIVHSRSGEAMFLNDYPTLKTVMAKLRSKAGVKSMAIAKNVALKIDSYDIIHVFYKEEEVGKIKPNENTVIIPSGDKAWVVSKYLEVYDWVVE